MKCAGHSTQAMRDRSSRHPGELPSRRARRTRCNAFSMVELLCVIATIAILAAVAVPRFGNAVNNSAIDAAANRVITDLAIARAQAQCVSKPQSVAFTVSTSSYSLTGMSSTEIAKNAYTIKLTDRPYEASMVSAQFGAGTTVTFDIYGMPDNGGTVVIKRGSRLKTITLDANTGKASAT